MATEDRRLSRRQLLLAYAIGGFGLSMNAQIVLLIPLQARAMGAGFDQVGLIVGSGSLAAALSSVALGSLVDRLGPRTCYLLGTGSCAILSAAYIVPSTFWWFLALQPFLALSRTLGWVASQAYISDVGAPSERATHAGRFSFCSNVGQLAGPLLAGTAAETVGLRWGLAVPAAYALVFFLLGLRLPNGHRGGARAGRRRSRSSGPVRWSCSASPASGSSSSRPSRGSG
ncbi:MFS transporter [Nocardioides humi]|uniref:MFS transporter n=1 Tax=Nocardioides humi TaxID=449461 RepID=UPI0015E876AE|nr:MFS transporter [Nocardioides humi]